MRRFYLALVAGLALTLHAAPAPAAELRVLSLGAVQKVIRSVAADFSKATGEQVALTFGAPAEIERKLAGADFDLLICTVPTMQALDQAGALKAGSRLPLSRVGIGVTVREGAPVPDISTPEAFNRTLLAARSIVHGDPTIPNQSGAVTMKILANAGIVDAVEAKSRIVPSLNDGFAMVARGEIELALFNLVELPTGVRLAGPVPAPLQEYTNYETAVLVKSAAPEAAQAFIHAMASARRTWEASALDLYPYR
jgi:molybdate transport system substrate-binding protein